MTTLPAGACSRPVGRFLSEGGGFLFGWPGTGFDLAFEGTRISLDLSGSGAWIDLSVDEGDPVPRDLAGNGGSVAIGGLAPGPHRLRARKRTEGWVGDLRFAGASTDGVFLEPPRSPPFRLEFFGDSITCGYGCLDPDPEAGFRPATESFPLSWAGRAAEILGAEAHAQAVSGIGVVRNWPGVVGEPLPRRWRRAHQDREEDWDLSLWVPHVATVNLGTNDFGVPPFLPDDAFVEGMAAFLADIRSARPGVPVVVVDGPLLSEDHPLPGTRSKVRTLLDRAARAAGALRFGLAPCDPADGFGADHHPSKVQHERNAREYAGFLRTLLPGG